RMHTDKRSMSRKKITGQALSLKGEGIWDTSFLLLSDLVIQFTQ
ncbi:unnamed protein product, partial [marine sediment metagenome]